jgi:hypothetical protein
MGDCSLSSLMSTNTFSTGDYPPWHEETYSPHWVETPFIPTELGWYSTAPVIRPWTPSPVPLLPPGRIETVPLMPGFSSTRDISLSKLLGEFQVRVREQLKKWNCQSWNLTGHIIQYMDSYALVIETRFSLRGSEPIKIKLEEKLSLTEVMASRNPEDLFLNHVQMLAGKFISIVRRDYAKEVKEAVRDKTVFDSIEL